MLVIVFKYFGFFNENENLLIKVKGSVLVENLVDRVCFKCENKFVCWERDFY